MCNGHGTYKCGVCDCEPDFFGKNCECNANDLKFSGNMEMGCM